MAIEVNVDEGNDIEVNNDTSYDDLFWIFNEMHNDMQKLLKRSNVLENASSSFSKTNGSLSNENEYLKKEVNR